jgi:hypothetical protein
MADATIAGAGRGRGPALLLAATLLAAATIWFLYSRVHYVADFSAASYTSYFWPRRFGLLAHMAGGATAITTGLVQIWLGLSGRTNWLHRSLGKVYALGVAVGSVGGFYMALTIPGAMAYASGLFFLALAWVTTTGMALYAISRRQFDQHRDWMLRSYTVTFAFVTFRFGEAILRPWLKMPQGQAADDLDTLMAWACWAIPLLLLEVFIQLGRVRKPAV